MNSVDSIQSNRNSSRSTLYLSSNMDASVFPGIGIRSRKKIEAFCIVSAFFEPGGDMFESSEIVIFELLVKALKREKRGNLTTGGFANINFMIR